MAASSVAARSVLDAGWSTMRCPARKVARRPVVWGLASFRQIWPPGFGLSSMTPTCWPDSRAAEAAARPAGPAPTMRTSKCIGGDLHARLAESLAAFPMRLAVDGDAAFVADAHAAEGGSRFAGDG